jgi:energy-coupling factor transporter ATP-binding protein EcfA2
MQDVLAEIIEWSKTQPEWQRDALRRIFVAGDISRTDIDDLLDLCKAAHGLSDPRSSSLLSSDHIAVKGADKGPVTLTSVTHHRGVNALAPEQTVAFGPELTVVFGQNAAGKSGYTRILKRACRSRAAEDILGNVLGEDAPLKPQATIRYREHDKEFELAWGSETLHSNSLSAVSVFDAHCVPVYLRDKTDVAFRPFSLDVFDRLSAACTQVRVRLEAELSQLNDIPFAVPALPEGTRARQLIDNLTSLTSVETVTGMATLSKKEKTRLAELREQQRDAQVSDPKQRARELTQRADRIDALVAHLNRIDEVLNAGGVSKLQASIDSLRAAREALRVLRETTFTPDLLPGTGEDEWRNMWEATARFSSRAYAEEEFPVLRIGAICPFCQQQIDAVATERLEHFREYVTSTADAEVRRAETAHRTVLGQLSQIVISRNGTELTITEIGNDNPELAQNIRGFLEEADRVKSELQAAVANDAPLLGAESLGANPAADLQAVAKSCRDRAAQLQTQSTTLDPKAASELKELESRSLLWDHLKVVTAEIERKKRRAAYRLCLDDTATQATTRKSTELTKRLITDQLRKTFQEELVKVGFTHLSVEVQAAGGTKGALFHRLAFSHAPKITVTDVLSEGESRTLSLAAFLTELSTASSQSAVIFDDPVSSLDHIWRSRIAERLVAEAKSRQVIVFTHDILFLRRLIDVSSKEKVDCSHQYVRREGQAGISSPDLPWIAMSIKDRIGALRKHWQSAEKLARTAGSEGYEKDAREIYGFMREAWEQAITEVLLNDVVERYRVSIETQKVRFLHDITEADCKVVESEMSECSRWMRGHDEPAADGTPFPQPAELKKRIDALEEWVRSIRKRRS